MNWVMPLRISISLLNSQGRTLNFSVDEESGKPVVKVIDFETKEVIRQIPSEEVLTMAKAIKRLQEDLGFSNRFDVR